MPRYALGATVRLKFTVTDATGALVAPSSVVLTLQKPDGTQTPYSSLVNDSTGLYHQDLTVTDLSQLGHYQYVLTTTNPGQVSPGELDVFDPFEVMVLPLQDAKQAVNIPATDTTDDDEITGMLAALESGLEKITGGPLITRTITERVEATHGQSTLVLRRRPVVAVNSIVGVDSGMSLTLTDLDIDTTTGIVRRKRDLPFLSWGPYFTVTYTAGWGTIVQPAIQQAARVIFQNWWETQRGPAGHPMMGGEETAEVFGMPYPVPTRALWMLAPFTLEAYV
jgi:hypothetical protein